MGNATKQAIVQVSDGVTWGRICTETWKFQHANLVCNRFGYVGALAAIHVPFERSLDPAEEVYLHIGECRHNSLESCTKLVITNKCDCQSIDAGVICREYKIKAS